MRGIRRNGACGLLVAAALVLSGCAGMRNGGAPDPIYTVQADLDALKKTYETSASISNFYAGANTPDRRNEFISARLALTNLAYLQFVSSLTADKQALDAATDIFTLGLSVAGTLVGGDRAKQNLAAAAALALGSKSAIDKHYYFDKTAPALITAMNAQRKIVLVRILTGSKLSVQEYSFPQAVADLNEYYTAGTLNAAISAIQADAGAKEAQADAKIQVLQLRAASAEDVASITAVRSKFTEWYRARDVAKARAALQQLAPGTDPALPAKDVWERLNDEIGKAVDDRARLAPLAQAFGV